MAFDTTIYSLIASKLDKMLKDLDTYMSVYGIPKKQAEDEIKLYLMNKEKAILGNKGARDYVINQYIKILSSKVFSTDVDYMDKLIDFKNLQNNDVIILFEMLLDIFDMSFIIDKYDFSTRIREKDIRKIVQDEEETIKKHFKSNTSKLKLIAIIAYSREYGQDCIDTLQHHNINEIGIIRKDYVYIVYKGEKLYLDFLCFKDKNIVLNIQKKTTQNAVVNYDEHNPSVIASKDNSSRITVAGYDMTPTDEELYYNERIFNLKKITLEEMRDKYRTIDGLIYDFLILNQMGRSSHFITGAEMGVGKSTFLLAMMEKVPDKWGIGILDTQNELQAGKKYPWKNIKTLIQTPKRTISDCFVTQLKMARDVLYVGEITMPDEVVELINASLRLNAGVGATMHSLSPYEVVANLRNLMMRTDMYSDAQTAESDISRGINIIINLAHHPKEPKRIIVDKIVEIVSIDRDINIEPKLEGSLHERLSNLVNMAQVALSKYLYAKNYMYRDIFAFQDDRWIPVNLPSKRYFDRISKYVDKSYIDDFIEKFNKQKSLTKVKSQGEEQ